jgi:hypothetical protein
MQTENAIRKTIEQLRTIASRLEGLLTASPGELPEDAKALLAKGICLQCKSLPGDYSRGLCKSDYEKTQRDLKNPDLKLTEAILISRGEMAPIKRAGRKSSRDPSTSFAPPAGNMSELLGEKQEHNPQPKASKKLRGE